MPEKIGLPSIDLEPSTPAKWTVIFLHGLGADGSDFVPAVSELHLPDTMAVRFVFPHAPIMPITINNGYEMRAWYDITSLSVHGDRDEKGILRSIAAVEQLIDREIERGIKPAHIFLAGFSQGAVIALRTGLHYSAPLAGIMALSGYLPYPKTWVEIASAANQTTPIFLAHGIEDAIVPYALGKAAYTSLLQAKHTVDWHTYPIAHTVSTDEIRDMSQFLQKIIRS